MAYISYKKSWESKFDQSVCRRNKLQDLNNNHLKFQVNESYKKDEKRTTKFESIINEDVLRKAYLDEKLSKRNDHLTLLEKDYNKFKLQYNKQSVEDVLVQRAVKKTIQILFDKGLFDKYANADTILEDILFITRRRGDFEKVNDDIQWFCS